MDLTIEQIKEKIKILKEDLKKNPGCDWCMDALKILNKKLKEYE